MSNGRKVLSPPGRSSWVWWKPSQAQQMPAAKLEKEMSLAFKSHYWGSSFWSEEGRNQSFPCWPPVWRTFQEQLVCLCFPSFLTRQFVTTTQGPGSRVKGVAVCEPWARWHFRVSAISHRVSSLQRKREKDQSFGEVRISLKLGREKRSSWFRYPGSKKI